MKTSHFSFLKQGLLTCSIIALIITLGFAIPAMSARIAGSDENVDTTMSPDNGNETTIEAPANQMPDSVNQEEPEPVQAGLSEQSREVAAPNTEATTARSPVTPEEEFKADNKTTKTQAIKEEKPSNKPVKTGASQKYVTLDFDNVEIGVLVKFVSELTGKNFIIDDKVKGRITIMSPKKIPVEDVYKVFLSVLEINGFTVVPSGNMVKIIPSALAREKGLETRTKKDSASPEDRMVTQIIPLERANPDEVKRILDPMVPKTGSVLSYPPAGMLVITDYLSNIKRIQEIVTALDVEGAGNQISYIPLRNASASEVVKSLNTIFQQGRVSGQRNVTTEIKLVADSRTNSIILLASGSDTENVRKLVDFMDKDVPRGESNIQVYHLQNSVAEDLAKVLTSIVKEGGAATTAAGGTATATGAKVAPTAVVSKNVQIVPDKGTNSLVIMAEREDYKIIENIIKQLDVPRPMVYMEALIMEVNANKDFKLGVEWRGIRDTGHVSDVPGSKTGAFAGSGGMGASGAGSYNILDGLLTTTTAGLVGAFPNGFSMGLVGAGIKIGGVTFPSIGAVVQAYKTDSEVSILSTPQIMTLNNEEAEINVGSNVPYVTRQDQTNTGTGTNYTNYSSYEYRDVGVILKVTPNINEGNYIRLKIDQQVTKVQSGADEARPTTLKRTAKTTVIVKDNETVVIGGLVGDSTDDSTYKFPLLGDIPLLGWLFKTKTSSREKTNLYVFLTPHIVRTQQDAAKLYQEKRETMGEVVEGVIKLNEKADARVPQANSPAENKATSNP